MSIKSFFNYLLLNIKIYIACFVVLPLVLIFLYGAVYNNIVRLYESQTIVTHMSYYHALKESVLNENHLLQTLPIQRGKEIIPTIYDPNAWGHGDQILFATRTGSNSVVTFGNGSIAIIKLWRYKGSSQPMITKLNASGTLILLIYLVIVALIGLGLLMGHFIKRKSLVDGVQK